MSQPVGGRGKAAPYATKLVRIPEPLESQIGELKSRYYGFLDAGGSPDKPVNWITRGESLMVFGGDEILNELGEIVKRWEKKLEGKDLKKAVRYSQASILLGELRSLLSFRDGD